MLELETVRFKALLVCPGVTESVAPDPRFDARAKLSVVAVTVRFTVVVFDTPDAVACTVTATFETGVMLAAV